LCTALLSRAEQARQANEAYPEEGLKALREAEALAGRALGRNPNDAWMLVFRGRARFGLGRREKGLADLRAAVLCRPDLVVTQYVLGVALLEAGQYDEARAALGRAKRLAPKDDRHVEEALRRLAEAEKKARQPRPSGGPE
jgi:tetratricopeptide (TPR) repeat protein